VIDDLEKPRTHEAKARFYRLRLPFVFVVSANSNPFGIVKKRNVYSTAYIPLTEFKFRPDVDYRKLCPEFKKVVNLYDHSGEDTTIG
jgi:hypothetical protein